MTADKIEDDYYSSIPNTQQDNKKDIKPVIKWHIKVKAKKVQKIEEEPTPPKKEDTPPKEDVPQKVETVKVERVTNTSTVKPPTPSTPLNAKENTSEQKDKGKKWKQKNEVQADPRGVFKKRKFFAWRWKYRWNIHSDKIFKQDDTFSRSNKIHNKEKKEKNIDNIQQTLVDRTGETVKVAWIMSVKEFSEKIWIPVWKLLAEFMKNGMMVTLNSMIDFDTATIIADGFQINLEKKDFDDVDVSSLLEWDITDLLKEDVGVKCTVRPPVISIMWHVDHWKTSLLDFIRKTRVSEKEAWGITQSIWAYQVEHNSKMITFLDTPWHEAFTLMRARWAKSTDIAILVVAADEWIKSQTIESINHAKEAKIPVIVAINKIDKEWANIEQAKSQLSEHWLIPEDWGWETTMVPVSAKTGEWIESLLEMILLVADMTEVKANPNRPWVATVIESHLDEKLWPVATMLINTWTLSIWNNIVCKWAHWRIKLLKDYTQKNIDNATPSVPVLVVWLNRVVEWWDIVQVVDDAVSARKKAIEYENIMNTRKISWMSWFDVIMTRIKEGSLKELKLVVKSDTNWSLEALKASLQKIVNKQTKVNIIHSGVWHITESDVLMAQASNAIIIGFWVNLVWRSKALVDEVGVELISDLVIYRIIDQITNILSGMIEYKDIEVDTWKAKVLEIFYHWKKFLIVWVKLDSDSYVEKWTFARIVRGDKVVWKANIENVKQWIENVTKIEEPIECWIQIKSNTKILESDILQIYKIEKTT